MKPPEKLELPLVVKDTDGNEHEVERLVYRLERGDKSRWAELFGTPEMTAQLIADNCEYLDYCGQCWMRAANCDGKYSTVLEWLRGDAE